VRQVVQPNIELIEKNLNLTVKNIMSSRPELFIVKGSGADFTEQNKSTAFDWLFLKSERIRDQSMTFN